MLSENISAIEWERIISNCGFRMRGGGVVVLGFEAIQCSKIVVGCRVFITSGNYVCTLFARLMIARYLPFCKWFTNNLQNYEHWKVRLFTTKGEAVECKAVQVYESKISGATNLSKESYLRFVVIFELRTIKKYNYNWNHHNKTLKRTKINK